MQFAQDGLEAVAAVTATPGAVRGGADGLPDAAARRLRGDPEIRRLEQPGARVPVIAMTASTVVGEKERCLAAGMDDLLVKPIDFALLELTLASWIAGEGRPSNPLTWRRMPPAYST